MSVNDEKAARRPLYVRIANARRTRKALQDDDIYRAKMAALFDGRRHATELNVSELAAWAVCLEKGQMELPRYTRPASDAQARKIHAIWGGLGDAGALRDKSRSALRRFCANMIGAGDGVAIDPDMMDAVGKSQVIEALKAMQARQAKEKSDDRAH